MEQKAWSILGIDKSQFRKLKIKPVKILVCRRGKLKIKMYEQETIMSLMFNEDVRELRKGDKI